MCSLQSSIVMLFNRYLPSIYLGETFASQAQVLSSLISLNRVDHVGRIHQLAIFPVHYLVHHLIFTPL